MGINFSSDILAFALEKEKLTRTEYIAIFEADISIGDVFACAPFRSPCKISILYHKPFWEEQPILAFVHQK